MSFLTVFLLITYGTVGTFTSVFKDRKSVRCHKTVDIKVFLQFFSFWWKDPDPGGQKVTGSGSWTLAKGNKPSMNLKRPTVPCIAQSWRPRPSWWVSDAGSSPRPSQWAPWSCRNPGAPDTAPRRPCCTLWPPRGSCPRPPYWSSRCPPDRTSHSA